MTESLDSEPPESSYDVFYSDETPETLSSKTNGSEEIVENGKSDNIAAEGEENSTNWCS